jgi:hypothetical protein
MTKLQNSCTKHNIHLHNFKIKALNFFITHDFGVFGVVTTICGITLMWSLSRLMCILE